MAEFADLLSPQLPAPPPPPRGGFADILAAGFGAGPDRMGAYQKGLDAGSQYKLRTAQTESALAEAEKRRAEAMRESTRNDIIAKAQAQPDYTPGIADMLAYATGAGDLARGQLGQQELGFRGILGDVNALPEQQFAAGQGVQGKVLPRIEAVGGQTYNLATDPNMQAPTMTPMQQAQLDAENALAGQRNRSPAGGGGGGGTLRTVNGRLAYVTPSPDGGTPSVEFITDPQMLGRERIFSDRVTVAGEGVVDELEAFANLPFDASSGWLGGVGAGARPIDSLRSATWANLRNAASRQTTQQYQASMSGLGRLLEKLESMGLMGSESAAESFNRLAWQPTDTADTRLYKLAQMAQTVENALETMKTNPALDAARRAQIERMHSRLRAAVPYKPVDILILQNSPSTTTLGDIMRQRGLAAAAPGGSAAPAASAAPTGTEPVRVTTVEEARALPPGTVFITPDGRRKVR